MAKDVKEMIDLLFYMNDQDNDVTSVDKARTTDLKCMIGNSVLSLSFRIVCSDAFAWILHYTFDLLKYDRISLILHAFKG